MQQDILFEFVESGLPTAEDEEFLLEEPQTDDSIVHSVQQITSTAEYQHATGGEMAELDDSNSNSNSQLKLAEAFIQDLEQFSDTAESSSNDQPIDASELNDVTQSGDITTTADFHVDTMDIQAEETCGVIANDSGVNDVGPMIEDVPDDTLEDSPLPAKRQRKTNPKLEIYLKGCKDGRSSDAKKTINPKPCSK